MSERYMFSSTRECLDVIDAALRDPKLMIQRPDLRDKALQAVVRLKLAGGPHNIGFSRDTERMRHDPERKR
jgi:hypothetical protein